LLILSFSHFPKDFADLLRGDTGVHARNVERGSSCSLWPDHKHRSAPVSDARFSVASRSGKNGG
jgi:hypothetical protein